YDPDHILVTRVRAPDGREYHLERDAAGRVVREVDYHGSATQYTYDAAGNLTERVNAVGQVVRYFHDKNGELVRIDADGESTVFERDPLGRLVRAENAACKLTWDYDELGRVVRNIQNGDILDYTHDEAGRCVQRTLRPGLWQKVPHTTRYGHDAEGRLLSLKLAGEELEIARDPLGRPALHQGASGYRLEQTFDARGSLAEQRVAADVHRTFTYDPAGNLTAVRDARWGLTEYRYDRSDRILSARRPRADEESFRYNPVGLLAGAHRRAPELDRDLDFHYSASGRIHRTGDTEHTYDTAGRLVRKTLLRKGFRPQSWEYHWDSLDRLTEVRAPEGQIWRYSYDALGRRVRKYNPSTREAVHFTWDGDVLLREVHVKPRGPQHDQQDVRIVHWQHEPGTFVPLAKLEDGRLSHIVTDHLGTPKELVTPTGEVTWRARHAVWGSLLATDRPGECPIRFQGQYEDPETGLYYNRFRYYDPTTALYLTPDPIGLLGGLQPTAYVHNPNTWFDPLGLHLNTNSATGNFGVYEILVNGSLYKYGKTDLNRTTKTTGLPTRLHQQDRQLKKIYGEDNVISQVIKEDLPSTKDAKAFETMKLQEYFDTTGHVPEGNKKSFKPQHTKC
ncbi:MAG TPA: RHS repeat-associated core domain-containing protein, partial [Nannocystaceae bacterium]|nr:RHS repeat-associated core domain-containing protein [Nannocystaceae bacterium]